MHHVLLHLFIAKAFRNRLGICVYIVGVRSSLCDFGRRLGSVISSGVLTLALTGYFARDGLFLFVVMGLAAKLRLSAGSEEMRCQSDKTVCLMSWLLSLGQPAVGSL